MSTLYKAEQQVEVFDPDLQRYIRGTVTSATVTAVLVSLNDRMVPVAVDPANRFAIKPQDEEAWLPLAGHGPVLAERYEISDRGRIRSRDRWGSRGIVADGLIKGRVLKTQFNTRGYECVTVTIPTEAIRKVVVVHVAVLSAFVGLRPTAAVARHLDGDTTNNQLSNLAWGSQSQNLRDRRQHGTDPHVNKTECPSGHPYDESNTGIYRSPKGHVCRYCKTCNREGNRRRYAAKKRAIVMVGEMVDPADSHKIRPLEVTA